MSSFAGGSSRRATASASAAGRSGSRSGGARARRERRPHGAEEAAAEIVAHVAEPAGGGTEALVLGEPRRELGGGLLRSLLLDLAVALAEQPAGLDLAERGDEQQELGDRLEVELLGLGEPLDVGEHDGRDRHLDELDLLAQHEREQEVERPRVGVEVELELEDRGTAHRAHCRSGVGCPPASRDASDVLRFAAEHAHLGEEVGSGLHAVGRPETQPARPIGRVHLDHHGARAGEVADRAPEPVDERRGGGAPVDANAHLAGQRRRRRRARSRAP